MRERETYLNNYFYLVAIGEGSCVFLFRNTQVSRMSYLVIVRELCNMRDTPALHRVYPNSARIFRSWILEGNWNRLGSETF